MYLPKLNFLIALIVTIPLQVRFLPTITNSFPDSQNFITHIHVSTLTILQYGITIVQLNLLLMYAIVCIQDLYVICICHECFKFCSMEIMPLTTHDHAECTFNVKYIIATFPKTIRILYTYIHGIV